MTSEFPIETELLLCSESRESRGSHAEFLSCLRRSLSRSRLIHRESCRAGRDLDRDLLKRSGASTVRRTGFRGGNHGGQPRRLGSARSSRRIYCELPLQKSKLMAAGSRASGKGPRRTSDRGGIIHAVQNKKYLAQKTRTSPDTDSQSPCHFGPWTLRP